MILEKSQEQIEEVLGVKFSFIKEQTKTAKQFALVLIKEDMKLYEDTLPFGNPQLAQVFKDFYDVMDFMLNPDTLFLNKDSYVFFWEIPESQFVAVYTMLAEYFEAYPSLERHIDATEKAFLKVINEIVMLKCPDYQHREADTFTGGIMVEADEPVVEPPQIVDPVNFDEIRIKSIFTTLHTIADPNYVFHNNSVSVYSVAVVVMLGLCSIMIS